MHAPFLTGCYTALGRAVNERESSAGQSKGAEQLGVAVPGPQAVTARDWLHRADELIRADANPDWQERVLRRVLRAEAGRLLGVPPPGLAAPPQ
jgi:hypothetical protein